jgi:3-hydroxybutyryl-CoA dehydrogenase
MGPFQLMDLIGMDVNFAVTRSLFEQRFHEPRLRPNLIQESLVKAGRLGRKSGRGFYDYATDPPTAAYSHSGSTTDVPWSEWNRWLPEGSELEGQIVGRVVSALINEAYYALGEGVASATDIDAAMQLGTNYPKGLIAWSQEIGLSVVLETLLTLEDWFRDGRYAPAPLLRHRA